MIIICIFFPCPYPHPAQQPVYDGMSSSEPEVTTETLGPDDRSPRAGSNFSWHSSSWLKWIELYGRLNLLLMAPPTPTDGVCDLWSVTATILLSSEVQHRKQTDREMTHKERQLKHFIYFQICEPFPNNCRPRRLPPPTSFPHPRPQDWTEGRVSIPRLVTLHYWQPHLEKLTAHIIHTTKNSHSDRDHARMHGAFHCLKLRFSF